MATTKDVVNILNSTKTFLSLNQELVHTKIRFTLIFIYKENNQTLQSIFTPDTYITVYEIMCYLDRFFKHKLRFKYVSYRTIRVILANG